MNTLLDLSTRQTTKRVLTHVPNLVYEFNGLRVRNVEKEVIGETLTTSGVSRQKPTTKRVNRVKGREALD